MRLALLGLVACGDLDGSKVGIGADVIAGGSDTEDTTPGGDTDDEQPTASGLTVQILETPDTPVPKGDPGQIRGRVWSEGHAPSSIVLSLSSDLDGVLTPPTLDPSTGEFRWPTASLKGGLHTLTLTAQDPDGDHASEAAEVSICEWPDRETFTTGLGTGDWKLYGNAYWDPSGWIEITGNEQSRKGAIYRVSKKMNPGDFKIEFRIATGGGINGGADGFAVNIVNADDESHLDRLFGLAAVGGCLAYGTDNGYCGTTPIEAFHIEFDTWYNGEVELQDPTTDNHIEITLDGDPGRHWLWAPVPTLEDLVWRTVAVQARGQQITVWLDGTVIIDSPIPGFQFDGGYIGVSGSTGWATNWHRFDDLRIYDVCLVPGLDSGI